MPAPKDGISEFLAMVRLAAEDSLRGRLPEAAVESTADGLAYRLITLFAGTSVYIPKTIIGARERRNREIYATWLAAIPSERPAALRRLIAEHGLSENQIYKICRTERAHRVRSKQASPAEIHAWKFSNSAAPA